MKIRIGIICPSEIAYRRFMPAIQKCDEYIYVGLAIADKNEWGGDEQNYDAHIRDVEYKKAEDFCKLYGGKIYTSYVELLKDKSIDAVYIPLPPSLHHVWAKKALLEGKHVFVEKPSTLCKLDTIDLIEKAASNSLALHENYMFVYHRQVQWVIDTLATKEIGKLRFYRIAFGFPFRGAHDFRYNKELGGGALLDCGGYTIKLASILLGESSKIVDAHLNIDSKLSVDLFGSATLRNDNGVTAQLSFGMDNSYKCSLEAWGSEGTLLADRIFTAPHDFAPMISITKGTEKSLIEIEPDDQFYHSLKHFYKCVGDKKTRIENYELIRRQSTLVEDVRTWKEGH